jgi:hypothetical protein
MVMGRLLKAHFGLKAAIKVLYGDNHMTTPIYIC